MPQKRETSHESSIFNCHCNRTVGEMHIKAQIYLIWKCRYEHFTVASWMFMAHTERRNRIQFIFVADLLCLITTCILTAPSGKFDQACKFLLARLTSFPSPHHSKAHWFSLLTSSSSSGVKSFLILKVFRISSGVFPLIMSATVWHVKSNSPFIFR